MYTCICTLKPDLACTPQTQEYFFSRFACSVFIRDTYPEKIKLAVSLTQSLGLDLGCPTWQTLWAGNKCILNPLSSEVSSGSLITANLWLLLPAQMLTFLFLAPYDYCTQRQPITGSRLCISFSYVCKLNTSQQPLGSIAWGKNIFKKYKIVDSSDEIIATVVI